MSTCRNTKVVRVKCVGRGGKTWGKCISDDMELLDVHSEWTIFRNVCRNLICGKRHTVA